MYVLMANVIIIQEECLIFAGQVNLISIIMKTYPLPCDDENILAEPKFNTRYGHHFTQEELVATVNKAYQEAQNGEYISNEEMDKEIEGWLK